MRHRLALVCVGRVVEVGARLDLEEGKPEELMKNDTMEVRM